MKRNARLGSLVKILLLFFGMVVAGRAEDLALPNGKIYRNYEVTGGDAQGILIVHGAYRVGVKIPWSWLTPEQVAKLRPLAEAKRESGGQEGAPRYVSPLDTDSRIGPGSNNSVTIRYLIRGSIVRPLPEGLLVESIGGAPSKIPRFPGVCLLLSHPQQERLASGAYVRVYAIRLPQTFSVAEGSGPAREVAMFRFVEHAR